MKNYYDDIREKSYNQNSVNNCNYQQEEDLKRTNQNSQRILDSYRSNESDSVYAKANLRDESLKNLKRNAASLMRININLDLKGSNFLD